MTDRQTDIHAVTTVAAFYSKQQHSVSKVFDSFNALTIKQHAVS